MSIYINGAAMRRFVYPESAIRQKINVNDRLFLLLLFFRTAVFVQGTNRQSAPETPISEPGNTKSGLFEVISCRYRITSAPSERFPTICWNIDSLSQHTGAQQFSRAEYPGGFRDLLKNPVWARHSSHVCGHTVFIEQRALAWVHMPKSNPAEILQTIIGYPATI